MVTKAKTVAMAFALALGLTACGDETPTAPTPPPADVAGKYFSTWTLQVLRRSDGFQKQFFCGGSLTLVQGAAAGSTAPLTGFAVGQRPCAPESYDLEGSVQGAGALRFVTDGPPPPEGPCPGGQDVAFTGQVTMHDGFYNLSARGVTTVTCPGFGEHDLTYLLSGGRL